MNFASDNVTGASAKVLEAIVAANDGTLPSYGEDALTARVEGMLRAIFETDIRAFLVATGTAANSIILASLGPPWGGVLCHRDAHVQNDEGGAPEFMTGGMKLLPLSGDQGKLAPDTIMAALEAPHRGVHSVPARVLSLTNLTECGRAYAPAEVAALAAPARARGLRVHMDGARFANAVAATGASPADLTWRAGVDMLALGATKNGTLAAEAIVVFDCSLAEEVERRRMRAGHLLSKGRLLAAQMEAWLHDGHWLDLARHANAMAARLSAGLLAEGVRLVWPTDGNEVFAILSEPQEQRLLAEGFHFYRWSTAASSVQPGAGEVMVRLVCSFATTPESVDRLLAVLRTGSRAAA